MAHTQSAVGPHWRYQWPPKRGILIAGGPLKSAFPVVPSGCIFLGASSRSAYRLPCQHWAQCVNSVDGLARPSATEQEFGVVVLAAGRSTFDVVELNMMICTAGSGKLTAVHALHAGLSWGSCAGNKKQELADGASEGVARLVVPIGAYQATVGPQWLHRGFVLAAVLGPAWTAEDVMVPQAWKRPRGAETHPVSESKIAMVQTRSCGYAALRTRRHARCLRYGWRTKAKMGVSCWPVGNRLFRMVVIQRTEHGYGVEHLI